MFFVMEWNYPFKNGKMIVEIMVNMMLLRRRTLHQESEKSATDDCPKPFRRRYQAPSQNPVDKSEPTIKRYQQISGKQGNNKNKTQNKQQPSSLITEGGMYTRTIPSWPKVR